MFAKFARDGTHCVLAKGNHLVTCDTRKSAKAACIQHESSLGDVALDASTK